VCDLAWTVLADRIRTVCRENPDGPEASVSEFRQALLEPRESEVLTSDERRLRALLHI